jgi:hypothetical protein
VKILKKKSSYLEKLQQISELRKLAQIQTLAAATIRGCRFYKGKIDKTLINLLVAFQEFVATEKEGPE